MTTKIPADHDAPILVAAVEGGGTSFVVAVAELLPAGNVQILHKLEVDSARDNTQETLAECASFFEEHKPDGGYHALGIASFGPVGVLQNNDKNSASYGCILATTPKANWRNVNLLEPLRRACQGSKRDLKVKVDTDVNAPALAEFLAVNQHGAGKDPTNISSLAYITCGTGVGVGMVIHGQCVHGRMHPEGGHVPVQPLLGDTFQGYSWGTSKAPFGGVHTVEGIASTVALTERLQQADGGSETSLNRGVLADLPDDHEIWDHAANALANLCVTLLLTVSIEKIVLGGGVLKRRGLMDKIRTRTVTLLNGYLELPEDMSTLICAPHYGESAGLMGAIVLAQQSLGEEASCNDSTNKDETRNRDKLCFVHGMWHGVVVGALAAVAITMLTKRCAKV